MDKSKVNDTAAQPKSGVHVCMLFFNAVPLLCDTDLSTMAFQATPPLALSPLCEGWKYEGKRMQCVW